MRITKHTRTWRPRQCWIAWRWGWGGCALVLPWWRSRGCRPPTSSGSPPWGTQEEAKAEEDNIKGRHYTVEREKDKWDGGGGGLYNLYHLPLSPGISFLQLKFLNLYCYQMFIFTVCGIFREEIETLRPWKSFAFRWNAGGKTFSTFLQIIKSGNLVILSVLVSLVFFAK